MDSSGFDYIQVNSSGFQVDSTGFKRLRVESSGFDVGSSGFKWIQADSSELQRVRVESSGFDVASHLRVHAAAGRQHVLHSLVDEAVGQGLLLANFRAQLGDLRKRIAHVRAQLEHLRDASTGNLGNMGDKISLR